MAKVKSKENWKKKRRVENLAQKEHRYYIFCEGEQTEPLYFQRIKELIEENPIYKNMVLIEIEGCGAETMRVIGEAEKYVARNKIDKGQIWCVYDKDSFPAEHFNGVGIRGDVLNKKNPDLQYHVAWSNQCIEYWFILHFSYYDSDNDRNEYINYLNQKFNDLRIGKYTKNSKDIFDILLKYGNLELAIRYAEKRLNNCPQQTDANITPGTKVHLLLKELLKFLPDWLAK